MSRIWWLWMFSDLRCIVLPDLENWGLVWPYLTSPWQEDEAGVLNMVAPGIFVRLEHIRRASSSDQPGHCPGVFYVALGRISEARGAIPLYELVC